MEFLNCVIYLVTSGVIVFLIGRFFPRSWIKEDSFPFKILKIEKNGQIYEKIKIKYWKTKLPDASLILHKIIPSLMPKKRLDTVSKEKIQTLVKESCVAEMTHFIAGILGLGCILIWKRFLGKLLAILYFIWNMLFVFIQRYNRPRLKMMLNKMA